MSSAQDRTREDVLALIAAAFEEVAPDGGGAEFIGRYFRHVPLDELTSRTPDIYAGAAAGHGFVNMRDRLGALGGELFVSSEVGTGSTIRGTFPADLQPLDPT